MHLKQDQKKIYSFTDLYLEGPQTNKIIFCLKNLEKEKTKHNTNEGNTKDQSGN